MHTILLKNIRFVIIIMIEVKRYMKKVVTLLMMMILILTVGCAKEETVPLTKDEKKFREEYESLNGKKRGDHTIMSIDIVSDNKMEYIDSKKAIDILEHKTGIIYFGFPTCPWCRNVVPILIDVAKEIGVDKIYYANISEERDAKHLDDDENIVVDKEGSGNYSKIVELLKDELGPYEGLKDDSIKRLYFPTIVFVKNGKVEDIHIGTLDSQEDPYQELNSDQKKELQTIFSKAIKKIETLTCDTDKSC